MVPLESKWFDSIRVYTTNEFEPIRIDSNSRSSVNGLIDLFEVNLVKLCNQYAQYTLTI